MKVETMVLTRGPLHTHPEFNKIRLDAPSPDLKPGQAATTAGCYRETVDPKYGTWRWVTEWQVLENR